MLFLSQPTRRTFFLVVSMASALLFSHHALAASPEHVAPLAILSTEEGKTLDLTNIILHDGAEVPVPKDATMTLYIATTAPVSSLHFSGIDTYGSAGVLNYAYQDGNGFQTLTVSDDSGASFTRTRPDGTANVTFVLPGNWSTTTLTEDALHRSAYWIRITVKTPYEKVPFVKKIDATVFTTQATFVQDSFGGYNGLIRATPTAGCGSDAAVLREAATTNGVHWFVVRSTATACTLTVSPPGFLSFTFPAKAFNGSIEVVSGITTLSHRTTVKVQDEQGFPVHDAQLSFDGLPQEAEQGGTYYFGNEDTKDARLIIQRPGYRTEDGSVQNVALQHVSGGTAFQQTVVTIAPNTASCNGTILPGASAACAMLAPNVHVITLHAGQTTSTASITIYTDSTKTTIADDRSRVGDNDASLVSNASGDIFFALREGTYYYTAMALGAPAALDNFSVLPDIGATLKVDYYPPTPNSTTPAANKSTITVSAPTTLYANRDLALITLTVKDSQSYRLPDITSSVSVSSTLSITPSSDETNDLGEVFFLLRSTRAGSTTIVPTVGGVEIGNGPSVTFIDPPPLQDGRVSATQSLVTISGMHSPADNSTTQTITVTVRNVGPASLAGKTVALTTSCPGVTIQPNIGTTDSTGHATFAVKGSIEGDCLFSATADRIPLVKTVSLTFGAFSGCPVVGAGSLIKLVDDHDATTQSDTAVYYVGNDCKRHAFSNAHVYDSWYQSFDTVSTVSAAQLASISLGKNVIYKPGVRLVKFLSLNNVYAVAADGKLRWVSSEAIAQAGYGANWNKSVNDVSDAFYGDYAFGDDLAATGDITTELQQSTGVTIDSVL